MTAQLQTRRSTARTAAGSRPDPWQELRGWGGNTSSSCTVIRPRSAAEIPELVALCRPPFISRGLGRAYGDAAAVGRGTVLDLTGCDRTLHFAATTGVIQVEAGLALDVLAAQVLPQGWRPPVLPGTGRVTVGGALAADVHGKNQGTAGGFADHVREFDLVTPDGRLRTVRRDRDRAEFEATAGGMGLTGVIAGVTLQLHPAGTAYVLEEHRRVDTLAAACAVLEDTRAEYAAAWLDGFGTGTRFGRGVVSVADLATSFDLPPAARSAPYQVRDPRPWRIPGAAGHAVLRPRTVQLANTARWHRAPVTAVPRVRSLIPALHPLDRVQGWPAWYGRHGLLQYQFVVPDAARSVVHEVLHRLVRSGYPPYLAVLKRFRRTGAGLLSFPIDGWSLAVDLPDGRAGLHVVLDGLDGLVAAAGGRVYLAKDSRLRPDLVETMYPQLPRWRAIRDRLDPERCLQSDLSRRLGLLTGSDR